MIQNKGERDQAQVATAACDFCHDPSEARLVVGLWCFSFLYLLRRKAKYSQFTLVVIVGPNERVSLKKNEKKPQTTLVVGRS